MNILHRKYWKFLVEKYNESVRKIYSILPEPKLVIVHDNREVKPAEQLFQTKNVFYSSDYRFILEKYLDTKFYVGSRIHGMIPVIANGGVVYGLYPNSKIEALQTAIEIFTRYNLDCSHIKIRQMFELCNLEYKDLEKEISIMLHILPERQKIRKIITEEKFRIQKMLKNLPSLSKFCVL